MARRNSRTAEVRITSTAKDFDRGFTKAVRSTQTFDNRMRDVSNGGLKQFNSTLEITRGRATQLLAILGGAGAAGALFKWAGDVRDSANALNESVNAVNVTFGEGASIIREFGENAATSVGLAESAFNQAVVPIGSLLRNFGFDAEGAAEAAVTLTTRAADLASVINTDVDEALQSISSGLQGQTEPMLKYGSAVSAARVEQLLLNEGLVESKSAITDADKVLGRYLLIMEDTARVAGDFSNTADDNANHTRIFQARLEDLRAEVGQAVIPVFDQLLATGEDLLPTLEELGATVVPQLAQQFGNFVVGAGELLQKFEDLPGAADKAVVGVEGVTVALLVLGGHPILAGLAAVAGGIATIGQYANENRSEVELLKQDLEAIGQVRTATIADILGQIPEKDLERLRDIGLELEDLLTLLQQDFFSNANYTEDFWVPNRDQFDTAVDAQELWRTLIHLQNQFNDAVRETEGGFFTQLFGDPFAEQRLAKDEEALWRHVDALRANTQATEGADLADQIHSETVDDITGRYEALDRQLQQVADSYAGQLSGSLSGFLDIFSQAPELETTGVAELTSNLEERAAIVERYADALTRLQDEGLFALASQFAQAGPESVGTLEAVIADIDAGGSAAFDLNDTLAASTTAIETWAQQMGDDFAAATVPVLDQARGFGEQLAEAVAAGVSEQQIDLLFDARRVQGRRLAAGLDGRVAGRLAPGEVQYRAHGGRVDPNRPYVVGERRMEVFQPDRPGTVHPSIDAYLSSVIRQSGGTATGGGTAPGVVFERGAIDARGATNPDKVGRVVAREVSREIRKYEGGQRRPI